MDGFAVRRYVAALSISWRYRLNKMLILQIGGGHGPDENPRKPPGIPKGAGAICRAHSIGGNRCRAWQRFERVFPRLSTAEYRETAPPILRLGTGADMGPGAVLLPAVRPAALPHVRLAHVDPDRVVHDPVHDRVGVDPAAEPRVPVLLLELGAEDGRGGAAPQLHQLQQHVLDAVLRDVGGAGDRVPRQPVHRPQPQDLSGPDPSRHVEIPRSLDCMVARA